jgi:hypothetical protein
MMSPLILAMISSTTAVSPKLTALTESSKMVMRKRLIVFDFRTQGERLGAIHPRYALLMVVVSAGRDKVRQAG